jgi:hypothetical protein
MYMLYNFSAAEVLFIVIGTLGLYLLIVAIAYGKKLVTTWGKPPGQPIVQTSFAQSRGGAKPNLESFPPLIDKPADHPLEQAGIYQPTDDEPAFEIIEDEGATTLLKEAESVVEQIQDVVNHIASHPANPDEVCSKIRSIVSEYRIFMNTEYFEAINSFVAVTVQRDCDLALTEEDLKTLWYAEAA